MKLTFPSGRYTRWLLVSGLLVVVAGLVVVGWIGWQSLWFGARDPYLQVLTPHGVTVRWQTARTSDGLVHYGPAPGALTLTADDGNGKAHQVALTGLQPATRYFYSVGEGEAIPFTTPPEPGPGQPVRLWAFGDSGEMSAWQQEMRKSALEWMNAHPRDGRPLFDFALALGDNAYDMGSNQEYQEGYFQPFAEILRSYMVWPVYGNHDARRWAYQRVFTFPEKGEAGGVPSGSWHYYSFDQGPMHVVVLDSQGSDRSTNGPMLRWLREDLKANKLPWLVAAFHHPPYTRGGHNSDVPRGQDQRLFDMRENALPILEAAGVDLVLTGHSHDYERSQLMDCHYGVSSTMVPGMMLEQGKEGAVFHKASLVAPHEGEVVVVAGSGSKLDNGPLNHPAMAVSAKETGSMVIDVAGNRMDARFINGEGKVADSFTIVKDAGAAWRHPSVCR